MKIRFQIIENDKTTRTISFIFKDKKYEEIDYDYDLGNVLIYNDEIPCKLKEEIEKRLERYFREGV